MSASAWRSASNRATTLLVSMPSLITLSATWRRTGSRLLSPIDDPEPPLADLLQKFVTADGITNLLLLNRQLAGDFHGFPEQPGRALFEKGVRPGRWRARPPPLPSVSDRRRWRVQQKPPAPPVKAAPELQERFRVPGSFDGFPAFSRRDKRSNRESPPTSYFCSGVERCLPICRLNQARA